MQGNQSAVQVQRDGNVWAWQVVDGEGRTTRSGKSTSPQEAQRAALQVSEAPLRLRSLIRRPISA